jgi:hypothetical protein
LNFFEVEVIRPPAQIFAELALRKGAKLAAEITDVGVVDVAGDDVAEVVAAMRRAERIGRLADDVKGVTATCEESDNIVFIQRPALDRSRQDRVDFIVNKSERCLGGRFVDPSRHPRIRASKARAVRRAHNGRSQRGIEPSIGKARIRRINRKPFDQDFASLGGFARERVEVRPRAFRIDIVRGDG